MTHYQDILSDLNANSPQEIIVYPPSYEDNMLFEEKFIQTRKALFRAKSMSNRKLTLANAFYLGQLLEVEAETERQREQYARQLTTHYRIVIKRLYYIFETLGVEQIMRTTETTLTAIRSLSSKEYEDLVLESLRIFNRN